MQPLTLSADRLSLLADGSPFIWRGTLDWPAYGRHLNEGAAYTHRLCNDRRSVGANTICCAGMLSWWQGLHPGHPRYWEELRPFADIAAEYDLRVCFVVLCDTRALMPDFNTQLAHWERFIVTLGDKTNVTCLVANQPGHPSQTITPAQTAVFTVPIVGGFPPILCARDNPMESANPVLPPLDFTCYCSSRHPSKGFVEVGSSMWYVVNGWPDNPSAWRGTHRASILFEPARIEQDPSNGWDDPGKWRQLARSLAFKGTCGGNIYSRQGRDADVFTGRIRACAVEYLGNIPNP
jgi:hypothetical protein